MRNECGFGVGEKGGGKVGWVGFYRLSILNTTLLQRFGRQQSGPLEGLFFWGGGGRNRKGRKANKVTSTLLV